MQYQIQEVKDGGHDDYKVHASHDGVMNPTEQSTWYNEEVAKLTVREGYTLYLVTSENAWFHTDKDAGVETSNADTSVPSVDPKPTEVEPTNFQTVAQVEIANNTKERLAKYEADQRFQEAMSNFGK